MIVYPYYKGLYSPLFASCQETLLYLVHNTEEIMASLFKQGYSIKEQIELFKGFLEWADTQLVEDCKKNNSNKPSDDVFDFITNLNYWTCVLGLLRYKAIKEDKNNGLAIYEREDKHKEVLKKKLSTKIKQIGRK